MEARLATAPAERQRALGIALYLDPQSERLRDVPEAEKQEARKYMKEHNPFLVPPPPEEKARGASV
jgi:hypothetical protein